MKRKPLLILTLTVAACVAASVCAVAKGDSPANTEKIQNINKLLELQGGVGAMQGTVGKTIEALREKVPQMPSAYLEGLKNQFDDKFLSDLHEKLVSVYDKYLTAEQVAEMVKFYESPAGKQIVKVMPQIVMEQYAIARKCAETLTVQVTDELNRLTRAAAIGDIAKVQDLLAGGGDINAPDAQGVTPLMVAAYKGNTDMAKLLVDKGADIGAKSKRGSTALMAAVQSGNNELVKFLLRKGADANAKEELGLNTYQIALMQKKSELAALLKSVTADTNPARPAVVVVSLGKGKECLSVMSRASEASEKISCLHLGQEVIPIADVPQNNGWTLIQYPILGWVPPVSLKQKLVIGEPQRRVVEQPQESVVWEPPAEGVQASAAEQATDDKTSAESAPKLSERPRIWWLWSRQY